MICMSQNNSRRKGVITRRKRLVTCKPWYYKLTTEVWSEVKETSSQSLLRRGAPAGHPNENSNNRKIASRAYFSPSPQLPYDTKRPLRKRERNFSNWLILTKKIQRKFTNGLKSAWRWDEKLLIFASFQFLLLESFCLTSKIKHETVF